MSYDVDRGVTVLFGGWDGQRHFGQTWEYDGARWRWRQPTVEPGPRDRHSMTYDSARGVTVLFGGNPGLMADTWEWNGTEWSLRATSGPSGGGGHAMVYINARGVSLLSKFDPTGVRNQTWEWDGDQWTQLAVVGPPNRVDHAMAYDSNRERVVLFGGTPDLINQFADTWEFGVYPDCDQSTGAGLDIVDFLCFQNRYAANDPYACNCDTGTGPNRCDVFDFLCFQNLFSACGN